jgi:competence protein ComGF
MTKEYYQFLEQAKVALRNAQMELSEGAEVYSKLDDLMYSVEDLMEGAA